MSIAADRNAPETTIRSYWYWACWARRGSSTNPKSSYTSTPTDRPSEVVADRWEASLLMLLGGIRIRKARSMSARATTMTMCRTTSYGPRPVSFRSPLRNPDGSCCSWERTIHRGECTDVDLTERGVQIRLGGRSTVSGAGIDRMRISLVQQAIGTGQYSGPACRGQGPGDGTIGVFRWGTALQRRF